MFNSHDIIPIMQAIKQARLPGIHADLERGYRHRPHVEIHIVLMNAHEPGDAHTPIAFIPLDDGCFPHTVEWYHYRTVAELTKM